MDVRQPTLYSIRGAAERQSLLERLAGEVEIVLPGDALEEAARRVVQIQSGELLVRDPVIGCFLDGSLGGEDCPANLILQLRERDRREESGLGRFIMQQAAQQSNGSGASLLG